MVKNDLRYSLSIEIGKFQLIFYYKCWTCQEKNARNLSRSGQQGDHHHRNHFLLQTFVRELQTSRDKLGNSANLLTQERNQILLHFQLQDSRFISANTTQVSYTVRICQLESVEQSCSSYRVNLIAEM